MRHDGIWWDPKDPAEQWVGTLRWDRKKGAALTLIIPRSRPDPFAKEHGRDVLWGTTTDGTPITLIRAYHRSGPSLWGLSPHRVGIFANRLLVGFYADAVDPLVTSASVKFDHLGEWWGRSNIQANLDKLPEVEVRGGPTPALELFESDGWRISLQHSPAWSVGDRKARLKDVATLELRSATPQPLSEFQRRIAIFGDLLSLATFNYCVTTSCKVVPAVDDGRWESATFHAIPRYKGRERRSILMFTVLRFRDIEPRLRDVMGRWFSANTLHDVRALYLIGVYGGGVLETKLLALTQAVEAFHRRFCGNGRYMEQCDFETNILPVLKAAIPKKKVSSSHYLSLKAKLEWGNELSQSRRMSELVAKHAESLSVIVDSPKKWVRPLLDHRNVFTHFPHPWPEETDEDDRVLGYNWFLRMLLEVLLPRRDGIHAGRDHGHDAPLRGLPPGGRAALSGSSSPKAVSPEVAYV